MELHVTGRHIHLPADFREHAEARLAQIEHLLHGDRRAEVVVTREGHGDGVIGVEITLLGRPPVIRAEASDVDKTVAFDHAFARLAERIRKASERRRSGKRRVVAAPDLAVVPPLEPAAPPAAPSSPVDEVDDGPDVVELAGSPIEVRVKKHRAEPMTLEQAVYEMEMVGHDFYLFIDADSGLPSALYKRRGWSYGVLHLDPVTGQAAAEAPAARTA